MIKFQPTPHRPKERMTQLLEREGPSINTPQEDGLCCVFQDRAQAAAVYSQKIGPRLEQAGPALVF